MDSVRGFSIGIGNRVMIKKGKSKNLEMVYQQMPSKPSAMPSSMMPSMT